MTLDAALATLASACGIEPGYHDGLGEWREPSVETLRAILAAMGVDAAHPAEALAQREAEQRAHPLPPAIVVRQGAVHPALAFEGDRRDMAWRLLLENGDMSEGEGPFALPRDLAVGYHSLELRDATTSATSAIIVAPPSCHRPAALDEGARWWGFMLQLYGVRSGRNAGIGDFTDLLRAGEASARRGAAFVGVNPLHALSLADPTQSSPYRPSSRLFANPLYLDVEAIADFREVAAKDTAFAQRWQAQAAALRTPDLVDYAAVAAAKRAAFATLFAHFSEAHLLRQTERARAFERFRASRAPSLRQHATHEALRSRWGKAWPHWPAEYRDAQSGAVRRFAEENAADIALHEYLQWQVDLQLERVERRLRALDMPLGLYADLAVSIAPDGSEAWSHPGVFARRISVGAPPDAFVTRGQSWGLPPFVPDALRASAYAPFIATLRANMRHAGALRIDHVMALERLFWVPEGMEPSQGAYVRYPLDDLLGIVALESRRSRTLVVGEDLGTVSGKVRAALHEAGILSYRLLLFEREREAFRAPAAFPVLALAAWSTHDLPTFAGWWHAQDIDARTRLITALESEGLKPRGASPTSPADASLTGAIHEYLARTPSMLTAIQMEDIFGVREQANLPGTIDEHPNWRRKLPVALEAWAADARFKRIAARMRAVRGERAPQPQGLRVPRATYRLQLHAGFTFDDARALVPYLAELGVSHVYCSPILAARPGSLHGYDVVDHARLNAELGSRADFDRFVQTLHEHGLGLMADIVPNHMVVLAARNGWWEDVLRHGQRSQYAGYFDIDWQPPAEHLRGRVLLPILAGRYGDELDAGRLTLAWDEESNEPAIHYFEHRLPVDANAVQPSAVASLNGTPGDPASFDALHALLEAQAYRLAYWRVAHDEINYRRFFDVNELAALRQEHPGVFEDTHRFIVSLVRGGAIDALRIDHPDGLFDPKAYFDELQQACGRRIYVAVEKILAPFEDLPADWRVSGTTGYRFLNLVNALFVDPAAEGRMTRIYHGFVGERVSYARVARESRRLAASSALASEVTVAANRLAHIAQGDRATRDFTFAALREGLADVLAAFPIYRTYIDADVHEADRAAIERAVEAARAARRATDPAILAFIRDALTCELPAATPSMAAAIRHFARKFQQVSAPVMAKGLEDTAFYRYNRLVSLNEVGGEPALFGLTTAAFFRAIRRHARRFPHTMLATSTHDNKRSEDVRARIDALSEMPAAWRLRLRRWQRMNASKVADVDGTRAPSLNDEYLLYQTLVGTFPAGAADADPDEYRRRIVEYLRKAAREAKVHTSWAHIDEAYEAATTAFIEAILDDTRPNPFLDDLRAAIEPLAWIGLLNSLSMTVLKHTLPGVPDCYQGNETWDFSLVDPDNRRAVDFARRRAMLASLKDARASEVFAHLADGRAKMLAMWKLLALRRDHEALFAHGVFVPLTARGARAAHVVAFARRHAIGTLITIVPRLAARLGITPPGLPCGRDVWGDTYVEAPFARDTSFTEIFTAREHRPAEGRLDVAEVLAETPFAVLFALNP